MRTIATLATLLLGLAVVFWAPTAKAHCPHGNSTNKDHCPGEPPPEPGATLGDLECTTDEIAKFDGTDWVCDDSFVELFVSKVVFASSGTYTGDLGGIAGADATCGLLAFNVGLSGSFKAWLGGDDFDTGANPLRTFTNPLGPYVLVDGTQVAQSFTHLITGQLDSFIDLDEDGAPADDSSVWTGVLPDGRPNGSDCSDWTTADEGANGSQCPARKELSDFSWL